MYEQYWIFFLNLLIFVSVFYIISTFGKMNAHVLVLHNHVGAWGVSNNEYSTDM